MRFIIHKTSEGRRWRGGSPHKLAKRCEQDLHWYIEIENVQQLLGVAKSNDSFNPGEIVIYSDELCDNFGYNGTIEIYDDYRE